MNSYKEFKKTVQKLNSSRKHKVSNSFGVYDSYKYIRKHKWLNIGTSVTEKDFYAIIRRINNYLAEELALGKDVKLPHRMGTLELRKKDAKVVFIENKLKTNLPIDWDSTLKLWYENEDSFNNKTLIRLEEKELFRVYYNKSNANYKNKYFYKFSINRELKRMLKQQIKHGTLDAFKSYE